jgi:hypothetical protein
MGKTAINKQFIITCAGFEEGDIECAFEESIRLIKQGFLSGWDRNETGAFSFEVKEEVPAPERVRL